MKGRVVSVIHRPAGIARAVAVVFGAPPASLEKRTLVKRGKPVASTYVKRRS